MKSLFPQLKNQKKVVVEVANNKVNYSKKKVYMIMKTKMKRKVEMIKISVEIKLDQSIKDKIINQLLLLTMSKTSYKTFQIQIGGREILKAFNKDQITKVSQTCNRQLKEEINLSVNLILR